MASRLTFRPPPWATLLFLAACALFASAGIWQLGRKAQKEELFAGFAASRTMAPLQGVLSDAAAAAARYQPIRVRGRYDAEHQILLDNIVRDGQTGYQVLTPLRTDAGNVLVNRGWIAADPDRRRLPDIDVSVADREIRGLVDRLPQPGLRLEAATPEPGTPWPRLLLFPTAEQIAAHLGYPVADYQVLLDPAASEGFTREWRPAVSGPEMHLGYAVQWFAFAIAAAVIYITLNLKKR